jgi:hypothetical protein
MDRLYIRYNLTVGPYVFVQDYGDPNEYHAPGGLIVDEEWVRQRAQQNNWGEVSKVCGAIDGRADNANTIGDWERETADRWKEFSSSADPSRTT